MSRWRRNKLVPKAQLASAKGARFLEFLEESGGYPPQKNFEMWAF